MDLHEENFEIPMPEDYYLELTDNDDDLDVSDAGDNKTILDYHRQRDNVLKILFFLSHHPKVNVAMSK